MKNALLAELDHEMKTTRAVLDRVPFDEPTWKPHPKSFSIAQLATHVANIPFWAVMTMQKTELDISGGARTPEATSHDGLLEFFDKNVGAAREALSGAADDDFRTPWTLRSGEQTIFTLPRAAVLRSFVMSHLIHHRGQLSVYLRLRDIPVPSIYGPSADES